MASASSTYSAGYPVSAVNNNERTGAGWAYGGGWNDATSGVFPDWVQINFNGSKTIDRVVVYTLQDNYSNPIEPTDTSTFSIYGLTDFTVQGWNGSAWVVLGIVTGNNLVKRTVTFTPFTTDRIRLNITGARSTWSTLVELEAWDVAAPAIPATTTSLTTSATPATAGTSVRFTATVTGSNPTGSVAFTDGNATIPGCSAVALTGNGNSPTATCSTSSLIAGVHSIIGSYSGDAANAASASTPLAQTITAGAGSSNVALASAGAVASASSTYTRRLPGYRRQQQRAHRRWLGLLAAAGTTPPPACSPIGSRSTSMAARPSIASLPT